MRRSSTDSWSAAALSGLRISWESPAVMVPTAASFSAIWARRERFRFSAWSRTWRIACSTVTSSSCVAQGFTR